MIWGTWPPAKSPDAQDERWLFHKSCQSWRRGSGPWLWDLAGCAAVLGREVKPAPAAPRGS